jgi:hypothetical protein
MILKCLTDEAVEISVTRENITIHNQYGVFDIHMDSFKGSHDRRRTAIRSLSLNNGCIYTLNDCYDLLITIGVSNLSAVAHCTLTAMDLSHGKPVGIARFDVSTVDIMDMIQLMNN